MKKMKIALDVVQTTMENRNLFNCAKNSRLEFTFAFLGASMADERYWARILCRTTI